MTIDRTYSIRPARPEDVPAIVRLIRGLANYEHLEDSVDLDPERLRAHLFGQPAYAEALVCEQDGAIIGFALFFHNYSTFLARPGIYLEDLYVEPDHRGRGVGKALLARLAAITVERECGRLEWSVLNWNTPAIAFYEAIGAEPLSDWHTRRLTGDALHALALSSRFAPPRSQE